MARWRLLEPALSIPQISLATISHEKNGYLPSDLGPSGRFSLPST